MTKLMRWLASSGRQGVLLLVMVGGIGVTTAATLPKGAERLRELAVVPELSLTLSFGFTSTTRAEDLVEETSLEERVQRAKNNPKDAPARAEWQLQLGKLYNENDDTNSARGCFEQAVALARRRSESHPQDGRNLSVLAEALDGLQHEAEAENLFRRATLVASNDWQCWAALGRFLNQRSATAVLSGIPRKVSPSHAFFRNPDVLSYPPPPEQMEHALQWRTEAATCFNRAVLLAPNEADVFLARAFHLGHSNWVTALIRHYRGEDKLTPERLALSLATCPGAAPDWQKAAELKPKAYKLISWIVWTEWCTAMTGGDGSLTSRPKTLNELPDQSRQVILQAMRKLKALGEDADRRVAAGALASWCMMKAMLTEEHDLMADLQRAVELDPNSNPAWDMLIGLSVQAAPPEKFSELCRKRLRHQPTARNYLTAAKALYRQMQFKEAATHAQEALKLDRKYVPAALMVAALDIRQGAALPEINKSLDVAKKLLEELSDKQERTARLRELILNVAILYGLDDNSAKARELLERILRENPDDEDAREILSALP